MDQEKLKKKIRKLSREQQVRFAWVCAMRALPFLGAQGNFDFWKPEDRHKHLGAVFRALDVGRAAAAAYAAAAARDADRAYSFVADRAYAADAAAYAAARAAADARKEMEKLLEQDLKQIQAGGGPHAPGLEVYGKAWQALEHMGCSYWW